MSLPPLILASASPRRAQLLWEAGLDFEGRPVAGAGTLLYHFRPRELLALMESGARGAER